MSTYVPVASAETGDEEGQPSSDAVNEKAPQWRHHGLRCRLVLVTCLLLVVFFLTGLGSMFLRAHSLRATTESLTNSSATAGHDAAGTELEKEKDNGDIPIPPVYYNFSCPFEWSRYSCVHQGQNDKARAGRDLMEDLWNTVLRQMLARYQQGGDVLPQGTRMFLSGDSLLRQLFVALGCMLHSADLLLDHYAHWSKKWPCKYIPNCIRSGPHGAFDVASLYIRSATNPDKVAAEIHYIPKVGNAEHVNNPTTSQYVSFPHLFVQLQASMEQDGFVVLPPLSEGLGRESFLKGTNRTTALPSVLHPGDERRLTDQDILLFCEGVHHTIEEDAPLVALQSLGRQIQQQRTVGVSVPQLWYLTTPTQHFETANGQYEDGKAVTACSNATDVNPRREKEKGMLANAVDLIIDDEDDLTLGFTHVDLKFDCTHYCMPGVPDMSALRLVQRVFLDN